MAIALQSQVPVNITAASGSTSVTVPSGCTLGVLGWSGYAENGLNVTTLTLNGVAHTAIAGTGQTGTNDVDGCALEYWISPSSGSQTLAWSWTNTPFPGEGPAVGIWFFSGTDTSTPIRAGGFDPNGASITVASSTTDYVLGYGATYSVTLDCAPSGSGQTNISTAFTHNSRNGRAGSEDSPGATTTTFTCTEIDARLMAVSIQEAAAGGATSLLIANPGMRNVRANPVYRMSSGIYMPARA